VVFPPEADPPSAGKTAAFRVVQQATTWPFRPTWRLLCHSTIKFYGSHMVQFFIFNIAAQA